MKLGVVVVLFFLGFSQLTWGQASATADVVNTDITALASSPDSYSVQGATRQQEALVRSQIRIMQPSVLPLRVVFVAHWKYVDNTRTFHLHVPAGYNSALFTHLPSRTVFIDADRYFDETLGYWLAHELGHLVTNSPKEQDAEKAAQELRTRLKKANASQPQVKTLSGD